MIHSQAVKVVSVAAGTVGSTNGVTAVIDRSGFDQADVFVSYGPQAGTAASTAATIATLAIKHSDDTNLTTGSTISGLVAGTDFTLPTHTSTAAEGSAQVQASVDLRAKGKYLKVSLKPQADTTAVTNKNLAAFVVLSRAKEAPDSAAERGVAVFARG